MCAIQCALKTFQGENKVLSQLSAVKQVSILLTIGTFPDSCEWAEKKEPGKHCLLPPEIFSGNLEVKSALLHSPPRSMPTFPHIKDTCH